MDRLNKNVNLYSYLTKLIVVNDLFRNFDYVILIIYLNNLQSNLNQPNPHGRSLDPQYRALASLGLRLIKMKS